MAERFDPPSVDRHATRAALLLVLPPAVFLLQFVTLYVLNALACRFGWSGTWFGMPRLTLLALAITALACLVVALLARGAGHVTTEGEPDRAYDQAARHAFVAKARALVTALTIGAMLLVALPVLLAPACT